MKEKGLDYAGAVREFSGMAYSLAFRTLGNREDAKDVVQQAFLNLYEHRHEFQKSKSLKNWIYTITLNAARDFYRSKKRKNEVPMTEQVETASNRKRESKVSDGIYAHEMLSTLAYDHREAIVLYYLEERSISEIATLLNISESLVKVRLHRARKKLIAEFVKKVPDEL
ncbi:RNA polymerase sigma factor [Fibrobacterota bacterium]